jgi:hypothetical protein
MPSAAFSDEYIHPGGLIKGDTLEAYVTIGENNS